MKTKYAALHPKVAESLEELRSELLYLRGGRATLLQFLLREKIASAGWNSFDNRHQMLIDVARAADLDLEDEDE